MGSLSVRWMRASVVLFLAACGPSVPGLSPGDAAIVEDGAEPDVPVAGCTQDVDCNDGIACTIEHCGTDGLCASVACTDCCGPGYECDVNLGCTTARTPCTLDFECADAIPCTLDRCLDGTFCEHTPQDSLCGNDEICLPALGCIPTPPAVCATDDDCFPGQPCMGEWSCVDEFGCQFIRPPDCDDGDDCTADLCDDAMGGCYHDAPVEVCNGMDDDCDSQVDEDFECVAGSVDLPCTDSCGTTGTQDCGAGCVLSACTPPAETCTGIDDDCDGLVDEGFACVAGTASSCPTTCGSTGSRVCLGDCTFDTCVPPAETCNGVDDDCDSVADDGFTCVRDAIIGSCTTSCGSSGTQMCSDSCTLGACTPPPESCNGLDDDCDGAADETFTCAAGSTLGSCTTTCGSSGVQACSATCTPGTCTPPAESCNGVDDDCDGAADETFTCVAGAPAGSCTTTCGSTGSRNCTASCTLGSCNVPPESCNGLDDDCDGATDETFTCAAGSSLGSCTTTCGSTGSRTCTATCTPGTCTPPAESCNGVDDDCDGTCDDGFTCCAGATSPCGVLGGGTGTATCLSSCAGWDMSGCTVAFDPTGTYVVSPAPSKTCAFGLVSFTLGTLTFSDSGSVLVVTGAPCAMTGPSASGGTINVTCILTGSCDERYTLTGTFTGTNTWTGTFVADFTAHGAGACFDCGDQTWMPISGTR